MKKVNVRVERSKDGYYWLNSQNLQNVLVGNGQTLQEAKEDFAASYDEMKLSYIENNKPIPEELIDLEFDYQYDTASALVEFSFINLTALAKEIGINASLMHQYKAGQYISPAQAEKIQLGINRMGERMVAFRML